MDGSYIFESPIGMLEIREKGGCISGISLCGGADNAKHAYRSDLLYEAHRQLSEYFCGRRRVFDLPVSCEGRHSVRQYGRSFAISLTAKQEATPTLPQLSASLPQSVLWVRQMP